MDSTKENKQVKSKQRVMDHGEVYTNAREVNAMLDLVMQETERIDSRFLEPACGTGNFLTEVLNRKLNIVEFRYKRTQLEYERSAILAISSIYGIDILEDNVIECRNRLFGIFNQQYERLFKKKIKSECQVSARYILDKNIIVGDALTLHTVGEIQKPIIFSEWSFPFNNSMIKRRDFQFSELFAPNISDKQLMLNKSSLVSDQGNMVFIPQEINSFPPVHFLRITEAYGH